MSVRREKRRDPETGRVREFWMIDFLYHHPDGRRQRVRRVAAARSEKDAASEERRLFSELEAQGERAGTRKEVANLTELIDGHWWPVYPGAAGNRPSTIAEKEGHIRLYIKPLLGRHPLGEIKGEVLDGFFAALRKESLSEKTIKNIRATLRRILASAVEWGYLDKVPTLPKVKAPEPEWDLYNQEEAEKLLAGAISSDARAALHFALHTGSRAGEQMRAEWGDVDYVNGRVRICRSADGEESGPTKGKRTRWVPLTPSLRRALKAHRHLKGKLIFCQADGSPLTIWRLRGYLETACRRAGVRLLRWHDLRHSFASQAVAEGVPLPVVQRWLGHSTIEMTMRYSHLAPGADEGYIARLDKPSHGNVKATEASADA